MEKKNIKLMFSSIAPRYDFLNSLISFGLHYLWKKKAVRMVRIKPDGKILDLCTGTGDLAILIAKQMNKRGKVLGLDFCPEMLEIARKKANHSGLDDKISFIEGDIENLNFPENYFDGATIAFGIRNTEDFRRVFSEVFRVLKKETRVVCLEFSPEQNKFILPFYKLYSKKIIPFIGVLFSGNREAYKYLVDSIRNFLSPAELKKIMEEAGFSEVAYYKLGGGIVAIHVGVKK